MQDQQQLRKIGIVGGGPELRRSCRSALRNLALLRDVNLDPDTGRPLEDFDIEVLLYRFVPPFEGPIKQLALFRSGCPNVPILLLGSDVPNDLAVELIKLGIDDYLSVPVDFLGLHRKVMRALKEFSGPSFGWSVLHHFNRLSGPPQGKNRRHCFRVNADPGRPVMASTHVGGLKCDLEVVNLSIATDGWPGGLLISVDPSTAQRLPFDHWERGQELELVVDFSDGGHLIEMLGQMVSGLRPGPSEQILFALQYWTRNPNDESRIRKYWAEAQRLQRNEIRQRPTRPLNRK